VMKSLRSRQTKSFGRFLLGFPMLAALLAGCGTGAANSSWPGLLVREDTAYLADNNHVAAVNIADGSMRWQYPVKGKMEATLMFYSDPIMDSQGKLAIGSYDGSVVRLNPATGDLLWRNADNKKRIIAPVLEGPDGKYYVSPEGADLTVLNPEDGKAIGTIPLDGGSSWGMMAANGERIFAATLEHKVIALTVSSGQRNWTRDMGAPMAGGISLVDGRLYLGTFDNKALSLDAQTGDTVWEIATKGWVWQPPVVKGDIAYLVDLSGTLQAVSVADGKPLWSVTLDGPAQVAPVVDDTAVYIGQSSGKVRAFSAVDGKPLWEFMLEGNVYGSMQMSGDRLLVAVMGSKYQLVSMLRSSGAIQWTFLQPTD
jgi:outer membrane protein assembly factor BamB